MARVMNWWTNPCRIEGAFYSAALRKGARRLITGKRTECPFNFGSPSGEGSDLLAPEGFMDGNLISSAQRKSTEYLAYEGLIPQKSFRSRNTLESMDTFLPSVPTIRSQELQYIGPEETALIIKEIVRRHQVFMQDFWVWFNELNSWRESLELRLERIEKRLPVQEVKA